MNAYDAKRLAFVRAIKVEIDSMKINNREQESQVLTTKQVRNILAHPLSYSKATRQDAVKAAIETLDAIAIAKLEEEIKIKVLKTKKENLIWQNAKKKLPPEKQDVLFRDIQNKDKIIVARYGKWNHQLDGPYISWYINSTFIAYLNAGQYWMEIPELP